MEWHEDLENICQQAGLKGKKLSKVTSLPKKKDFSLCKFPFIRILKLPEDTLYLKQ